MKRTLRKLIDQESAIIKSQMPSSASKAYQPKPPRHFFFSTYRPATPSRPNIPYRETKSPQSPAALSATSTEKPLSPMPTGNGKKEFCLDRSVMFMKRLEDDGKICHINKRDREMIEMVMLSDK